MQILNAVVGCGCALAVVLGAQSAEATSPKGRSYEITVYPSFGGPFADCFAFGSNGTLAIQGFGPVLYRLDELNSQPDAWQSIGNQGSFGLAFHGTTGGSGAQTIQANGISTDGDTFILLGVRIQSCAAAKAQRAGGAPYRR